MYIIRCIIYAISIYPVSAFFEKCELLITYVNYILQTRTGLNNSRHRTAHRRPLNHCISHSLIWLINTYILNEIKLSLHILSYSQTESRMSEISATVHDIFNRNWLHVSLLKNYFWWFFWSVKSQLKNINTWNLNRLLFITIELTNDLAK